MRTLVTAFAGYALLTVSYAQPPSTPHTPSAGVSQKPGAWDTLKLANLFPTPNDARNFGVGFPIGNGRLGAKVFGWPAADVIPLNDTTLWSGPGPEHF